MAPDPEAPLAERLARLEQELRELRARVAALERMVGSGQEHPSDRSTVRQKVAYDWQS